MVAGEQSGDAAAAAVMDRLEPAQRAHAFGMGGAALAASGLELVSDLRKSTAMGFGAVARRSVQVVTAFAHLVQAIGKRKPSAALLVNYHRVQPAPRRAAPSRRHARPLVRRAADLGVARGARRQPAPARGPACRHLAVRGGALARTRGRRALRRAPGAGSAAAVARGRARSSRADRARLRRGDLAREPGARGGAAARADARGVRPDPSGPGQRRCPRARRRQPRGFDPGRGSSKPRSARG